MITNTTGFISNAKSADRAVASVCTLVMSRSRLNATGLSGVFEVRPFAFAGRGLDAQRPTGALVAAEPAKRQAQADVFAAASAGTEQTTHYQHKMWAFRGPAPWSYPA